MVVQDPAEEVEKLAEKTEDLTGLLATQFHDVKLTWFCAIFGDIGIWKLSCLSNAVADVGEPGFVGMKKKKKKHVSFLHTELIRF